MGKNVRMDFVMRLFGRPQVLASLVSLRSRVLGIKTIDYSEVVGGKRDNTDSTNLRSNPLKITQQYSILSCLF